MSSSKAAKRSAGPGTCSAIRASARTATCTHWATASAPGRKPRRSPTGRPSFATSTTRPIIYDIRRHIRFRHHVKKADWSSADARWIVEAERTDTKERVRFSCNWLHMCSGYYNYSDVYDPEFAGTDSFRGTIVHPQFWPEDLDYSGKKVVVIGSGATAVTIVPDMAKTAGHVVMLQRSPTYMVSRPSEDGIANFLRRILPSKIAYGITRWKNVLAADVLLQAGPQAPRQGQGEDASRRSANCSPKTMTSAPISRRATIPGTSASAWFPTPTCSRRSATGSASIVTGEIDSFTRGRNPPEERRDDRRRTSSSPPPG